MSCQTSWPGRRCFSLASKLIKFYDLRKFLSSRTTYYVEPDNLKSEIFNYYCPDKISTLGKSVNHWHGICFFNFIKRRTLELPRRGNLFVAKAQPWHKRSTGLPRAKHCWSRTPHVLARNIHHHDQYAHFPRQSMSIS